MKNPFLFLIPLLFVATLTMAHPMKGIYSFWAAPSAGSEHKISAGFATQEAFRASFELSILHARKTFNSIELYTDTPGMNLLVNQFGLKFDKVHLDLNAIPTDIPKNLWAYGKLLAYSLQKEPFCHLDYDVFLIRPLPKSLLDAPIFAQSAEPLGEGQYLCYVNGYNLIETTHSKKPVEWIAYKKTPYQKRFALNCGIIGGQNVEAIADYARKAMQFISDNLETIQKQSAFHTSESCIQYEQYFLQAYCAHHGIEPEVHLDFLTDYERNSIIERAKSEKNPELLKLLDIGAPKGYIHLLSSIKKNPDVCNQIIKRLEHDRIIEIQFI